MSETNFKSMKVTQDMGDAEAHKATVRPEGSRRGRDNYQTPSKTEHNSDSKSFPRKNR